VNAVLETMVPLSNRRFTRPIFLNDRKGNSIQIGGGAPIVVQSMCSTDTSDKEKTIKQIYDLATNGCEVVRVAVPDKEAAAVMPEIVARSPVPIVADIHFHYQMAIAALNAGVAKLRLNPGNIRKRSQVEEVTTLAKKKGVPIRIGVNHGSLPPVQPGQEHMTDPERMVDVAFGHIRILEDLDFRDIAISLKAFDVPTMVAAYRLMADRCDYPLHLGVTEAGTARAGSIRSAVGMGILLNEGIGDTIRVSLADDPVEEVYTCYEILKSLGLRQKGTTLVACPSCGRVEIDVLALAAQVDEYIKHIQTPIKVAVMGCPVNGPGEARDADVGVAGGREKGVIFRYGQIVRSGIPEDDLFHAICEEIDTVVREREAEGAAELVPAD
jgi:(E)-4-hydroxy-3-methylbut-2-enyl-diphosphate synthase